jgi:hypothetical protein
MKNFMKKQEKLERGIASAIRLCELKYRCKVEKIIISRKLGEPLLAKNFAISDVNMYPREKEQLIGDLRGFIALFELKENCIISDIHVKDHEAGNIYADSIIIAYSFYEKD